MDIKDLESQISYYATKYYNGEPEISDEQFDMLVEKLRMLNPNSSVLKTGWGFEVNGDKVKHKYSHIGSLDKTKTYEEIPNRFKDKTVFISPKLDGLSAVVYYENGKLVKAITRGNGEYGKDITDKLRLIVGPSIQDNKFTGAVRGELIINDTNWNILQSKYKDLIAPRNFAAGIINRKEIDEDIKYIDLVVYKIVGQENKPIYTNREDILNWLNINFEKAIPNYYYPVLNKASWDMYNLQTFNTFKEIGYGLDGLVLTDSNVQYNVQTKGYVYNEVAFKYEAEKTNTFIKDIHWELSRTQRLIPVAEVEPVELSGAVIHNATCNNAKWVKDLGLGAGAEVVIQRANEVIPKILEVIQESEQALPVTCPVCNSNLVWDGVDLKCNNLNCPNIKTSDLQQWCECVGETDGLQWTLMKQYLDNYGITDIDSLYFKQKQVLMDLNIRKLSITELKIKEFFEKLYLQNVDMDKALLGLNIPRLGEKTVKLLSNNPQLVQLLYNYSMYPSEQKLIELKPKLLELVKDATTTTILENIQKFKVLQYLIETNNRLVYTEQSTNLNKFIAVTGALQSMKRKDFEKYINQFGFELTTNLKKCMFLVNNDINSTSSKNKQAKEYGVPIVTEEQFLSYLQNN